MQLDDLETVRQPNRTLLTGDRGPDLVMPPLSLRGAVAVAEAEQGTEIVKRGHGAEPIAADVGRDVPAPCDQQLALVAHRLAVHRDDVVQSPRQIIRGPRHDPHRRADIGSCTGPSSSPHQPMTSRSPVTATTAKRANSSSAYHRRRSVASMTRR